MNLETNEKLRPTRRIFFLKEEKNEKNPDFRRVALSNVCFWTRKNWSLMNPSGHPESSLGDGAIFSLGTSVLYSCTCGAGLTACLKQRWLPISVIVSSWMLFLFVSVFGVEVG